MMSKDSLTSNITAYAAAHTTVLDSVLLLHELSGIDHLQEVRHGLARQIAASLDEDKVRSAPLAEVAMSIYTVSATGAGILSGEQLAWFVQRLIELEQLPGGPYRRSIYDKVYLVDNAWVYGALHALDVSTTELTSFLLQPARHAELADLLGSDLNCMAVDVLPTPLKAAATRYLQQAKSGGCHVGTIEKRLVHAGALTVKQYRRPGTPFEQIQVAIMQYLPRQIARDTQKLAVYSLVRRFIADQPPQLQPELHYLLNAVLARDKSGEIALFPIMTAYSLTGSQRLDVQQLTSLGAATILCWMSYTVYDDFLDGEGVPLLLSAANSAHRGAIDFATRAADSQAYEHFFAGMDAANTWEQRHARLVVTSDTIEIADLPDYGDFSVLADRAGGHIAGACMVARGMLSSKDYAVFEQALRRYTIAKQLNDDLHDWKQDMAAGRITPVMTLLLQDAAVPPGTHAATSLLATLEVIFYKTTFSRILSFIRAECIRIRQLLASIPSYAPHAGIGWRITSIERSCDESERMQQSYQQFLYAFQPKTKLS